MTAVFISSTTAPKLSTVHLIVIVLVVVEVAVMVGLVVDTVLWF